MKRSFTIEDGLFLAAFLIALMIRFIDLGRLPLSDVEATWALQALRLARGEAFQIGPQPVYIHLTALLFFFTQATEFTARFWPALVGSLIVAVPFLFRGPIARQTHRYAPVLLSFALALDPGLLALSRTADGAVFAIVFTLLTVGCFYQRRWAWTGVFMALALLSGPYLWPGLLGIGIALLASRFFFRPTDMNGQAQPELGLFAPSKPAWGSLLLAGGLTLLVVGTLFFRSPAGLSAAAASLPAYLQGANRSGSGQPANMFLISYLSYHGLALFLGVVGLVLAWVNGDRLRKFFSIWWLVSFLIAVIAPDRLVVDLGWSLIPLWGLSGWLIPTWQKLGRELRKPALGLSFLILMLLVSSLMNALGLLVSSTPGSVDSQLRLFGLIGGGILVVLVSLLIAFGWSWHSTVAGLSTGIAAFLVLGLITAAWRSTGLSTQPQMEMWRTAPLISEEDLLTQTVGDLSLWNKTRTGALDLVVVGIQSPALEWSMRGLESFTITDALPAQSKPALILTSSQNQPVLPAEYRGQNFSWQTSPPWALILDQEWLRWVFYRQSVEEKTNLILWVRADLFPGSIPTGQ